MQNTRATAYLQASALAALGIFGPLTTLGQATGSETYQGGGADSQLAEIVVTAEKRAVSIQDTPVSVTAISGAELQAQGLYNTEEALRQIPGVAAASAGPGQTEYTIRGLSSSGPAVATVGFYLDDAPMTAPTAAQNGHVVIDPDLYDLNRVEVLRGPQGTLYGSGSMGGTIKLITNQPNVHEFSASAKVDGSDTQGGGSNHALSAMLNLPLIDGQMAIRIVGTDDHTSGWIDRIVLTNFPPPTNPQPQCAGFAGCTRGNVLTGVVSKDYHDVNNEDVKGVRASVRYEASDRFSMTASVFHQRLAQEGLSYYDNPPGTEAHYQPADVAEPFADTFRLYNLVADFALTSFNITSATSYWARSQAQVQDISETTQTIFGLPSFSVDSGGAGAVTYVEVDQTKQFSEELRFTSIGDNRFQWLVGGFYSDYTYVGDQNSLAAGFIPLFDTENLFTGHDLNHLKQRAAFGEVSYKLTDRLSATAGLREYSYTQDGSFTVSGIVETSLAPMTKYVSASNSGLNPKFTLSYENAHQILVYGTIAKGFRPGAGNEPIPTTGTNSCLSDLEALGKTSAPTQYNPDSIWSYELGEKATLWDRRLTLNSAIYYERWTNVQQAVGLACGFSYTDNVGTANVRGAEVELNVKLSPSLSLAQSGGYTHAVVASTFPGSHYAVGERLLNVPTYSASTSVIYTQPINEYHFVARLSNVAVGPSENLTYSLAELPGYDIANFRLGLAADRWSAFVFLNNLANKQAALYNTQNYALSIPSVNRVATNQPRTFGLALEYHH